VARAPIEITEELLSRDFLTASYDSRQPGIARHCLATPAALATKPKSQLRSGHVDVAIPERRQTVRIVLAHVLRIADPDLRALEQAHDRGEHLLARHPGQSEMATNGSPDLRQRAGKGGHAIIFGAVARASPSFVIAVLFSAARVAPDGLEMPGWFGADPNFRPGRRNDDLTDSPKLCWTADAFAVGVHVVDEPSPAAMAAGCRASGRSRSEDRQPSPRP
jgi:hypothetical protein